MRGRSLIVMTVAALLAAGCGSSDAPTALPGGPGTTAPPATAAASSPATTDSPDTAYLRFWDAVIAAHRAADPKAAALATVAADPELGRVRSTVARNRVQQLSLRGEVGHEPAAAAVSGTTATLEDCYDISGWNPVNLTTGERVAVTESGGTGRYRARWTLRRTGGSWLVVDQKALGGC